MRRPSHRQRSFIERLNERERQEDRAALAALRRGLGKTAGAVAETHQYIAPWLPNAENQYAPWVQADQDAYYLIGSLFALHPKQDAWSEQRDSRSMNLGWSFRRLSEANDSGSIEKRFAALLNSHRDYLATHLQGAVSLLKAHETPVNWAQLLVDIQDWDDDGRTVQRGWAQAYWGGGGAASDSEAAETTDQPEAVEDVAAINE